MRSQQIFVALIVGVMVAGAALVSSPRKGSQNLEYVHKAAWSASASTESGSSAQTSAASRKRILGAYGKLPLSFEANRGQTDAQVKFLSRGSGYSLFLTSTEAVLALKGSSKETEVEAPRRQRRNSELETRHSPRPFDALLVAPPSAIENPESRIDSASAVLRLKLMGADPSPQVAGIDELPGKNNYFIGNDPKKWRSNVPTYAKVKYRGVYPGIDLVYHGNQRQLEYDFVVAPGANPGTIRLSFQGAEGMEIGAQGDLVLHTAVGEVREHKPVVYQEITSSRELVACSYVLRGKDEVGFAVAPYDSSRPLVIDPVLSYSTYLGGSGSDGGNSIAVDSAGNTYVTGGTNSIDFPIKGAYWTSLRGSSNAFVTKIDTTKSGPASLVYSTYLGGSSGDYGTGIAVDSAGNAYVTGRTESTNFPTVGAFQTTLRGSRNAFVTKIDTTKSGPASLVYSTYLGGTGTDIGRGIAVDSAGNAYVTGETNSIDFPRSGGARTFSGGYDAFVTKIDTTKSGEASRVYSTFLGGSGNDIGRGIAVDSAGNVYVAGRTSSTNFPTTPDAFQENYGGADDAFVTKLNPDAVGFRQIVYSTYLGGSGGDYGNGIAVDSAGNTYVTGQTTSSTDFPTTTGAFQATLRGSFNAFVTKIDTTKSGPASLVYSTFLGGSDNDGGEGIAVDSAGNAYVTGGTTSTNFPTTTAAYQKDYHGGDDAFVTKLNASGSALVYSTYLGGSGYDFGTGIAVDSAGNAYVTGQTTSATDFPTIQGAYHTTFFGGPSDAFIAKVVAAPNFSLSLSPTTRTIAAGQSTDYPLTVTPQELVGTVALSCAGAPDAATCSISPASVTLDGDGPTAAQTATVTVTTTARSLLWPTLRFPAGPSGPRRVPLLGIALALLVTLAMFSKMRRRATPMLVSTILLLLLCIACGGGTSGGGSSPSSSSSPSPSPHGTPAGTYTLTLTGSSGGVTHTTPVTLTVN